MWPFKRRPPSNLKLLAAIYDRHYDEFISWERGAPGARLSKPMVPVNIPAVADDLSVNVDSVFGRLYFDLEPRHSVPGKKEGDPNKSFFYLRIGAQPPATEGFDANVINFPMLEALYAGLLVEHRRYQLSVLALVVSAISLVLSIGVAFGWIG